MSSPYHTLGDTLNSMACPRGCCPDYRTHVGSIVMGGQRIRNWENTTLSADRDAYKRMKDDGIQPKSVKGAAFIEKAASSQWEIEAGRILPSDQAKRVDSANAEAKYLMGQP